MIIKIIFFIPNLEIEIECLHTILENLQCSYNSELSEDNILNTSSRDSSNDNKRNFDELYEGESNNGGGNFDPNPKKTKYDITGSISDENKDSEKNNENLNETGESSKDDNKELLDTSTPEGELWDSFTPGSRTLIINLLYKLKSYKLKNATEAGDHFKFGHTCKVDATHDPREWSTFGFNPLYFKTRSEYKGLEISSIWRRAKSLTNIEEARIGNIDDNTNIPQQHYIRECLIRDDSVPLFIRCLALTGCWEDVERVPLSEDIREGLNIARKRIKKENFLQEYLEKARPFKTETNYPFFLLQKKDKETIV